MQYFSLLSIVFVFIVPFSAAFAQEAERIPLVYSTDLFQPPEDPDDHFDLAILFALTELDAKALLFDLGTAHRRSDEIGISALKQIEAISGKPAPPYAMGLRNPLRAPDDTAVDQPDEFQGGVNLLLETLRKSERKVVLFLTGSCRDFAAAFNREPELLKIKVDAVYVNAGNGYDGIQDEWNVKLDPEAYRSLMSSGLPIYWCPCFMDRFINATPQEVEEGRAYSTFYLVQNQAELLKNVSPELRNYFFYALNKRSDDPVTFLKEPPQPLPTTGRNMWCTGPFLHASGREVYLTKEGKYIACRPEKAERLGIADRKVELFRFEPVRLKFLEPRTKDSLLLPTLRLEFDRDSTTKVFRYLHKDYNEIMCEVLSDLLGDAP